MQAFSPVCAQWHQHVKDFLGRYTAIKAKRSRCLYGERSRRKVLC